MIGRKTNRKKENLKQQRQMKDWDKLEAKIEKMNEE